MTSMTNLVLFLGTLVTYFAVSCMIRRPNGDSTFQLFLNYTKRVGLVALLCAPFTIMGNVVTVLGNTESSKNIISLCSIYQKSGGNATALLFSGYQSAGKNAVTGIFSLAQSANVDAISGLFALYQSAGRDAGIGIGFSGYQKARRNVVNTVLKPE